MKRIVCLLLVLCLLPLAGLPAEARPLTESAFTDIPDEETRQAAELLRRLGVVTGTGGTNFSPDAHFNRAALSIIAVRLSGVFDVTRFGQTVRFPDVRAAHWAHRWVNAAFETGLMLGYPDGLFHPEEPLTYAHLITVLMRLLGYTDDDVGLNWPHSYINMAETAGLSKGMSFTPDQKLTRGQAARLICNMLYTPRAHSGKDGMTYIEYGFGVTELETVLFFDIIDGKTEIAVADKKYIYDGALDESFQGQFATLMLGREADVVAVTLGGTGGEGSQSISAILFFEAAGGVTTFFVEGDYYIYRGAVDPSYQGKLGTLTLNGNHVVRVALNDAAVYATTSVSAVGSRGVTFADGTYVPFASAAVRIIDREGLPYTKDMVAEEPVTMVFRGSTLVFVIRDFNVRTILRMYTLGGQTFAVDDKMNEYPVKGRIDPSMIGRTGLLQLDSMDNATGFVPLRAFTYQTFTVTDVRQNGFRHSGGFVSVSAATAIWGGGEDGAATFSGIWREIRPGETLMTARDQAGRLLYLFMPGRHGSDFDDYRLAIIETQPAQGSNPLVAAFGRGAEGATLRKNGLPAALDMLERWDVLMFYERSGIVEASSLKFSGHFSADPLGSADIIVQGIRFTLLPEAQEKIGSEIAGLRTFLFTHDGRIADVRNLMNQTTIGLAQPGRVLIGSSDLVIPGGVTGPQPLMTGRIGSVRGMWDDRIQLTPFEGVGGSWGELNLQNRMLGSVPIAPWCVFYDQSGRIGRAVRVGISDIPVSRVPADRILFAQISPSGYVTAIVMNNATGDAYDYGFVHIREEFSAEKVECGVCGDKFECADPPGCNLVKIPGALDQRWIGVSPDNNRAGVDWVILNDINPPREGTVAGIAVANGHGGNGVHIDTAVAVRHTGLTRQDFNGIQSVRINGRDVPIALTGSPAPPEGGDALNAAAAGGIQVFIPSLPEGQRLMDLADALTYCRTFDVFTDPNGHKVRLIIGHR